MKKYQAVNEWFDPLPIKPFDREQDAVAHIKTLREDTPTTFYVVELNVTSTVIIGGD